jgi:hypothetical protein
MAQLADAQARGDRAEAALAGERVRADALRERQEATLAEAQERAQQAESDMAGALTRGDVARPGGGPAGRAARAARPARHAADGRDGSAGEGAYGTAQGCLAGAIKPCLDRAPGARSTRRTR